VAPSQRFSDVAMRRSRSVLLVHGDDDQIVLYVDSAPGRSAVVPTRDVLSATHLAAGGEA
jgi:hypothetical protein